MHHPPAIALDFFQRSALEVAPELLGKYLVRQLPDEEILRLPVTEIEVYEGHEDKASHACRRRTPRNEVMFFAGGYFYVYLCYGVHWMLNIVCNAADYPAAILIRGVGEISGPGRLTRQLRIDRALDRQLAVPGTGLYFAESEITVESDEIERTPRIGIDSVEPAWREKPLRFVWTQSQ
ncbi:MAG: DNA-3-methyladenine glycosylase [Cyanobacteria bacterium J06641_5]